jgi:glycosyltransferase involved in cell wall biosynthesis
VKLLVVIPIFNEFPAIGTLLQALQNKGLDIVVIDDGSTDGGGTIAQKLGAYVIVNPQRYGKGYSLQQGFYYAIDRSYDGVITMDGDGQHSVEDLPIFLEKAKEIKSGIVIGNRMNNVRKMPAVRYLTNRFMSGLISWKCGQQITDTQCGYKYISTDILKLIPFSSDRYEIETEILMKASKKGFKVYSIPISTIYRSEVSHINPIKDTVRFFKYFFNELFSRPS